MSAELREGDVVMLCRHIFEDACQKALDGANRIFVPDSHWSPRMTPPKQFEREDGTVGKADFVVACGVCRSRREFDLVEEIWQDGRLHVADLLRGITERLV